MFTMNKKCICQICTCRRHKCPHNAKPSGGFGKCVFSEYTNQYTKHPLELTQSFKPEQSVCKSLEPLDDKTVHRLDYVQHPIEKPFKRETEKWQKPEGHLDDTTNYKNDFAAKPIELVKAYRPFNARTNYGKFQGEPTYSADYRSWGPQPKTQPVVQSQGNVQSEAPFDGSTNYKQDFVGHQAQMTKSMRPLEKGLKSTDPFDGNTIYKDNFKVYPLEVKQAKEKIQWEPNNIPLDDLSNYKKDFTAKDAPKVSSCRPEQKPFQTMTPFEEATTHKLDFIPWKAEVRSSIRPQENRYMPDGGMNFDTTTRLDYQAYEKSLFKRPAIRPFETDSVKQKMSPFDGTTHYALDYKPWERQPIERRKKEEYVASEVPFQGQATYKVDYYEKPMVGVKSAKPLDPGFRSLAPLDGMTEYKKEFIGKKSEMCPAGMLTSASLDPRFTFREQDEDGHVWYEFRNSMANGGALAAA